MTLQPLTLLIAAIVVWIIIAGLINVHGKRIASYDYSQVTWRGFTGEDDFIKHRHRNVHGFDNYTIQLIEGTDIVRRIIGCGSGGLGTVAYHTETRNETIRRCRKSLTPPKD